MDILYHHRTQGTGADPVKTAGSNPYTKKGGFKSNLLTTLSRSLFMEMTWRNYVGKNDALALGLK